MSSNLLVTNAIFVTEKEGDVTIFLWTAVFIVLAWHCKKYNQWMYPSSLVIQSKVCLVQLSYAAVSFRELLKSAWNAQKRTCLPIFSAAIFVVHVKEVLYQRIRRNISSIFWQAVLKYRWKNAHEFLFCKSGLNSEDIDAEFKLNVTNSLAIASAVQSCEL